MPTSLARRRLTHALPTLAALLALAAAPTLPAQSAASAQTAAATPAVEAPPSLTPPAGNVRFLTAHAIGTQNYVCVGESAAAPTSWVFIGPQATMFVQLFGNYTQQVLTHFLSPVPRVPIAPLPACTVSPETNELDCATWQASFDSSAVWGDRLASLTAGADPSCPNTGAIPCLLLQAVQTRNGEFGPGLLGRTTYIQRLNTVGGVAPAVSCKAGDQALVPYTADYSFYTARPTR